MAHVLVFPSWYPVSPDDSKGVFFRDQALALLSYGHRVGVVAVNMRSLRILVKRTHDTMPPPYEVDEGIPTYRTRVWAALPRIPHGNYWLWRRAARALFAEYVRDQGWPDVIHAHSALYAGLVAAEWGRENGIPVVLTEHSSGFARKQYQSWQLRLADRATSETDACITVSPALAQVLDQELPRSRGRWIWVPNVVADRFGVNRSTFRGGDQPARFLNLASMNENKGQRDLLEAFAGAFGGRSSAAELWIGGDGPLRDRLECLAEEMNIDCQVTFLGVVPPAEVPSLLTKVDAMVVASHYETFGVVAAEALMAGVPVVATRCGGPECIVAKGDGHLVAPGDSEELSAALVEIIQSRVKVDRKAIADRARSRFSEKAVAAQLTEIYEDVKMCNLPDDSSE